jgi:hypothetical protein
MRTLFVLLGLSLLFSCKKIETTTATTNNPVVQEELIKFTTNLDTGAYNVTDTLPLTVTVSSKLPALGLTYSVTTIWTDSSKQIFKLDSTLNQATLTLNISGHKKSGNYTLAVIVSSKATPSNTLSKNISFINDPLKRFEGYTVNQTEKNKDEINYWRDCGVMWDVIVRNFNILPNGQKNSNFIAQTITGDFNKDGYIDIFNPGTGSYSGRVVDNCQWLIWNSKLKVFESVSLFNDKNLKYFGGNQRRSVSFDLNKDEYTDIIIFDSGDDGLNYNGTRALQPIRIVLSDGKGGYDLKDLTNITPSLMYNHSGDIGDLNKDGYPDLICSPGSKVYISWGIPNFPYFSNKVSYFDIFNKSDNGFGEDVPEGAGYNIVTLADVNKDGWLDIVGGTAEQLKIHEPALPFDMRNKILINQGNGKFNKNGIINLPFYFNDISIMQKNKWTIHDYRVIDVNNDGLNDIIATGSIEYDNFNFVLYTQNRERTFTLEKDAFIFNINTTATRVAGKIPGYWKPWLILYDFNKDGQLDISYIDNHNFNQELKSKSVFIKTNSKYIEQDFYQFDPYIKSLNR